MLSRQRPRLIAKARQPAGLFLLRSAGRQVARTPEPQPFCARPAVTVGWHATWVRLPKPRLVGKGQAPGH